MTERDMQTLFGKYIKGNPPKKSEVYELKFTSGISIRFDAVKEHQREALKDCYSSDLYHKLTDQPWVPDRQYAYQLKKPFDCFCLVKVDAFVVVWFYKPREKKVFINIPISKFLMMECLSSKKSFREEEALEYGNQIYV